MSDKVKPLLRGHFHQAAFFVSIGASAVLLFRVINTSNFSSFVVYACSLVGLFGVSALYHRVSWSVHARQWIRRLDHCAIFILVAGTFTPVCRFILPADKGDPLMWIVWVFAAFGVFQSLFWVNAPKWLSAFLYVMMGWIAFPYLPSNGLIYLGGVIYTLGALVYALKWPNPWPKIFGYHEIFHILVCIAAACHFLVILRLSEG